MSKIRHYTLDLYTSHPLASNPGVGNWKENPSVSNCFTKHREDTISFLKTFHTTNLRLSKSKENVGIYLYLHDATPPSKKCFLKKLRVPTYIHTTTTNKVNVYSFTQGTMMIYGEAD